MREYGLQLYSIRNAITENYHDALRQVAEMGYKMAELYGGMGISAGRLREDSLFDFKFVGLSHNTLRGAAGGAVLIAELLERESYFD